MSYHIQYRYFYIIIYEYTYTRMQMFSQDFRTINATVPVSALRNSLQVQEPVLLAGLDRYCRLYRLFWRIIDSSLHCQEAECHNRHIFKTLKSLDLQELDMYVMVYIVTYFTDILVWRFGDLSLSYYIISKGHDYTLNMIVNPNQFDLHDDIDYEEYSGYFLSVLYYLLPDFKYKLSGDLR